MRTFLNRVELKLLSEITFDIDQKGSAKDFDYRILPVCRHDRLGRQSFGPAQEAELVFALALQRVLSPGSKSKQ